MVESPGKLRGLPLIRGGRNRLLVFGLWFLVFELLALWLRRQIKNRRPKAKGLLHIVPVPGFIEVRTKPKPFCVSDQPFIGRRINLDSTIRIVCIDGVAADK